MDYRLPRSIVPQAYELTIAPDLASASFDGSATMTLEVIEETDRLVCNSADLEIDHVTIDGNAATFELDGDTERLIVTLDQPLSPGPVTLATSFRGVLNDKLKGFYRSTYTDAGGVEQVIATTQFQSTDARRAFPCWDEPDFKATFDVTLVVEPDLVAVSNGGEIDRRPTDDGKLAIRFARTMPMSTYLVAFVVGPLEVTEPVHAGDVPVRIVHRPGQGHLTPFALEVAVAALLYFEDYYGIPYPSDKLDMIALPDFAMGAMENLGCVTYREVLLLVDPDTATQPELQNVADVVNHELAHMWFGDLVTMRWWNGIWLNEAFATFMELKATDSFRPEWERWTSFGISRAQAFDVDSLESTRAIEYPVVSPEDAEGMFDLLTYEKGAAVVRMLEQWLGEDTFRSGIRRYLATHLHGNTETHDLWDALEEVAGKPVRAAMETWIFQGGHPLVELSDGRLRQHRFRYQPDGHPGDERWVVPVQLRTTAGDVRLVELDGPEAELEVTVADVVTANHRGNGFYRVELPPDRLAELGARGPGDLDAVERFGLVDDAWALTLSGRVALATYLALLEGYRDEGDVSVWQRIVGTLGFVRHVAPDGHLDSLADRILHLIAPARTGLGPEPSAGEPDRTRQLRGTLLGAAGSLAKEPHALERSRQILALPDPDSELLAAAVKVIAANGGDADFAEFRTRFEQADNPQEEMRYLYALPAFPGAHHLDEVVGMALDGRIRTQNAPFVLAQGLMHREHGPAVWSRIVESWDSVNAQFPSSTIVRMLTGIRWLTDEATAAEVASFFADHPLPQGQKQLDQHLERLRVNTGFRRTVRTDLAGAFGSRPDA